MNSFPRSKQHWRAAEKRGREKAGKGKTLTGHDPRFFRGRGDSSLQRKRGKKVQRKDGLQEEDVAIWLITGIMPAEEDIERNSNSLTMGGGRAGIGGTKRELRGKQPEERIGASTLEKKA